MSGFVPAPDVLVVRHDDAEVILGVQERYDNHFDESPAWPQALAARLRS
jgi:hypothetical protein